MNKILIYISLSVLLFTACGGGSSNGLKSNSQAPSQGKISSHRPANFHGYELKDYLSPSESKNITIYKYKNGNLLREEKLSYELGERSVKIKSLVNLGGYIRYYFPIDQDDVIEVSIHKDEKVESLKMNNFVDINDSVTTKGGDCKVVKHFDNLQLPYDPHSFNDVLEIECPNSTGYYQKEVGLVLENLKSDLENNNLEFLPDFGERDIIHVDKSDSRLANLNLDSAKEAKVDRLWEPPYNLLGQGMKIGLVDGGRVLETHVELRGRVTNLNDSRYNKHATHTAGTLISKGVHLPSSRGFANEAHIYAIDYNQLYFADSIKALLNYGVLISNHSYGFEGPDGLGVYDKDSYNIDKVVEGNPYIIAVIAAGNDGRKYKRDSDFTKWFLIKGGANSKNVITVAAVDDDSGVISDFSSRGPIHGGRLKPDISLDGYNVLSTVVNPSEIDDDSYGRLYGTSMAAPAVTGTITLLAQRYKQINSTNPRLDTIKAIIFNTAKDIENPGPDFKSGFGQLDAYKAVRVIDSMDSDNSLVKLESIIQNEHLTYTFSVGAYENFRVSVAWVDLANEYEGLVNDLDIYLESEFGDKVYPFTLDEYHPDKNAVQTKPNHLDPQEQIETTLEPGVRYTLHILGTNIRKSQDFTLVSNIPLPKVKSNMKIAPMHLQIHDIYETVSKD